MTKRSADVPDKSSPEIVSFVFSKKIIRKKIITSFSFFLDQISLLFSLCNTREQKKNT